MEHLEQFIEQAISFIPNILFAAAVFGLGYVLIRFILHIFHKALSRSRRIDPAIYPFILTLLKMVLLVLLVLTCLDILSIPVTPLITALGAVGVAVSLALKDSLANLLGGSVLLVTKPFKIGDYCEIDEEQGYISEIGFVYTVLKTADNKKIFIPNGQVTNATVVNYNTDVKRRLDILFSIAYDADFELAQKTILDIVLAHPHALKDPKPIVRMNAHSASSIDILCRVWVDPDLYWELNWDLLESVKKEFDHLGINIPYPQMDVHIKHD